MPFNIDTMWIYTIQSKRSTPWFTEETCAITQPAGDCNADGINQSSKSTTSRGASVLNYKRALSAPIVAYFSPLISNNKHNSRFVFDTVAKLSQTQPSVSCSPFTFSYCFLWNNLPADIWQSDSVEAFNQNLKLMFLHLLSVSCLLFDYFRPSL